jgi:hypothetical protein
MAMGGQAGPCARPTLAKMKVDGIDERNLVGVRDGGNGKISSSTAQGRGFPRADAPNRVV